jgi:Zn finger protein HypA/HybF involved in hydrogenase expression
MFGTLVSLDSLLKTQSSQTPSQKPNVTLVQTLSTSAPPAQKKPIDTAKTLETLHSQQLFKLREEKDRLAELKADLSAKRAQLDAVEREFNGPALIHNTSDIAILTSRQTLERSVRDLEQKIAQLESGQAETDYFLRVGDILFSYEDAKQQIASGGIASAIDVLPARKERMPANSVYSYFSAPFADSAQSVAGAPAAGGAGTDGACTGAGSSSDGAGGVKRASDIRNDIGFKRDKALETYLNALNPDSTEHDHAIASSLTENYGNCPVCDAELLFNETFLDCPDCGHREYILVDSEKPSYKDPPREMSYYAYKKINHLNEWIAQFQAKETTDISQAVLDQIRTELKKERITDMSKLKPSKLKEVIKKLKLNRYSDHVAHILNRLNGISAPVLSREVEEKLRVMFKEIQFSFVKHCPKKRSNFLSYSYVLYKFCELLELDEYLPCFPLLKTREKLYMQDKIWQKICEDMQWEFIRTV